MTKTEGFPGEFERALRDRLPFLGEEESLEADANLFELGLDSLACVDLLVDLEDGFGVSFPDELLTAETFESAHALWEAVKGLRGSSV